MTWTVLREQRCFGGIQGRYRHRSESTNTEMTVSVYLPPSATREPVPVLYYLSGLTCTDENFVLKAGAQRYAAEHGLALVAPDTSPRGLNLPGEDDSYDFGSGAGFYVDATEAPWCDHYRMYSYVVDELPRVVAAELPIDVERAAIMGHSMGGHGALVCALRNPERYRSVSAFAPICAPMRCPWGSRALAGYLGDDRSAWSDYDASVLLIRRGWRGPAILVDQGEADEFLAVQLQPETLERAADEAHVALNLRRHAGYDHSYFFISSFVGEHIATHARALAK